jgi:hypothetical protein
MSTLPLKISFEKMDLTSKNITIGLITLNKLEYPASLKKSGSIYLLVTEK